VEPKTHLGIDRGLVGTPEVVGPGIGRVVLVTTAAMAADDRGLVHGGFVFGAADLAAMVAVDDPFVVLGAAAVRFTAPVRVGSTVVAEARVGAVEGRKHTVEVEAKVDDRVVLAGTFTAFVLDDHVLSR
jgi:acyl-coenzyme A thioesterase PaaI-like protein